MHLHFINVLDRAAVDLVAARPKHAVDGGDDLARKNGWHEALGIWLRSSETLAGSMDFDKRLTSPLENIRGIADIAILQFGELGRGRTAPPLRK
jgi:hypothetical protein